MEYHHIITEEEYLNLFLGKAKYYITSYKEVGYGKRIPWWRVFLWNVFHRHNKLSYDYSNYYHHYMITTAIRGEGVVLEWNKYDMSNFEKENNLQVGDKVDVFFMVNSSGKLWSAGGYSYTITADGWEKTAKHMGL